MIVKTRVSYLSRIFLVAISSVIFAGCATHPAPPPADWTAWQARRNQSIGGTNGWTTLVGLYWLKEGNNVVQSDRFPADHQPWSIGVFTRHGTNVVFSPADGNVKADGKKVTGPIKVKTDQMPDPTRIESGDLLVNVIQRGGRIGVRVKNPNSAARRNFKGLSWFPYDAKWRVEGKFMPFPRIHPVHLEDAAVGTLDYDSPGQIFFKINGVDQTLDVLLEGGQAQFFIVFRDETAGTTTYPGGRYLYVRQPDMLGRVVLDFNRAFTPPCGFTRYASCPLPPRQNWLTVAVRAGELKPAAISN